MSFRRFLVVFHRYCGLLAAAFLLFASATGCLLVFRDELDAALNPDLFRVTARPVMPAVMVVQHVLQVHPEWRIQGFGLQTREGWALSLTTDANQIFVDPADGHVIGTRPSQPGWERHQWFAAIHALHYTLLAGTAGRWFMGGIAVSWLILNISGACMTWPRRRPWLLNWRPAWLTGGRRLMRRPMPELHRVAGLWAAIFLTILASTSIALNFYGELFQPIIEAFSPPRVSPFDKPAVPPVQPGAGIGLAAAERLAVAAAARQTPGLEPVEMMQDAGRGLCAVSFAPGGTPLYTGFGRVTYYVDRQTGRIAWVDQPVLDGTGRLVLRSLYPLHSGQIAGLPTRLLVLALGLLTIGLAVTGFLPWWRRRRHRVAIRAALPRRNALSPP